MEVFGVDAFGDSAVVVKARLKTKPIQQWNVGREYRKRLKVAFDREGIEIPFPHRTIYWGEAAKPLVVEYHSYTNLKLYCQQFHLKYNRHVIEGPMVLILFPTPL